MRPQWETDDLDLTKPIIWTCWKQQRLFRLSQDFVFLRNQGSSGLAAAAEFAAAWFHVKSLPPAYHEANNTTGFPLFYDELERTIDGRRFRFFFSLVGNKGVYLSGGCYEDVASLAALAETIRIRAMKWVAACESDHGLPWDPARHVSEFEFEA